MATIKLKFRASSVPQAEGTLYFQVIHQRSVRCQSTAYRIFPHEWDERRSALLIPPHGERRAQLLLMQSMLNGELRQRRNILVKMTAGDQEVSMDELIMAFDELPPCKTVFTFLQEQAEKKEQMLRMGTAKTYVNAYRRFRDFRNGMDLAFDELTPDMIERYDAWLRNRSLKTNSIRFYLRTLNTLLCKAVVEGLLEPDRRLFSRVRLSYVATIKRAISEHELKAIAQLPLPRGSSMALARDIFMFSFYTRGMSFVDMAFLKKTDLKGRLLEYCRKKTNQHLSIAWERALQTIVDRYAHLTKDTSYMLPIIRAEDGTEYQQYRQMHENVNWALRIIGERAGLRIRLTTYVARHTWASIARNMNFSIAIISEGMGHRSYRTTQVYLDSIGTSRINDANKQIIHRISM